MSMRRASETIVVAGALAQRPGFGGHTWVFLQYLLGFRRLGFDVLFLDWLSPEICAGPPERSEHVGYLAGVMKRFGLGGAFCVLEKPSGEAVAGLPRREAVCRTARSAFLLNVMGYLDDEEFLGAAPRRVFLDIDPGFGQMWRELGLADVFRGHDDFVTIAENIGGTGCRIPTCGVEWIPTRPPVVLDFWPARNGVADRFTSVGAWRGPYDPVEFDGRRYGLRVHEFRRFAQLPRRVGADFELALDIDPGEARDLELLRENRWRLVDPCAVAGDPRSYQEYIAGSGSEFGVAKGMYVDTRSGWFSDRSACYLASAKPVLVQDTGLDELYPTGEGLLTFRTLEDAVAGVEEIVADYLRHARAARAIAEEHFGSDKVLNRLLDKLGVG